MTDGLTILSWYDQSKRKILVIVNYLRIKEKDEKKSFFHETVKLERMCVFFSLAELLFRIRNYFCHPTS